MCIAWSILKGCFFLHSLQSHVNLVAGVVLKIHWGKFLFLTLSSLPPLPFQKAAQADLFCSPHAFIIVGVLGVPELDLQQRLLKLEDIWKLGECFWHCIALFMLLKYDICMPQMELEGPST